MEVEEVKTGRTREESTSSTALKAQHMKELLSAKKTQLAIRALNEWKKSARLKLEVARCTN